MKYLDKNQVQLLCDTAKRIFPRFGYRNATAIQFAFRHGLRATELIHFKWNQLYPKEGRVWIERAKGGISGFHPLWGDEIRAFNHLYPRGYSTVYCFASERKGPLSYRNWQYIVKKTGAELGWDISSHILRHSCGFHLGSQNFNIRFMQLYLGHTKMRSTEVYAHVQPDQFREIQW
jgi:type 1 fimbriae regulatory protein FimB/type 1 fimbriae regulatory protein FimE